MTIRSKHDFASLSKVEPCARERRTMEKMQCLRSWTSWQSLCFRDPLCSSPNCPNDSPCCISRKPNRVPIVMLRSAGIRWIVRNFSRSGWPFIFSIIAFTTSVHRGRTMQFSIARFINCVLIENIRCPMFGVSSSDGSLGEVCCSTALSWPKWSPVGDVDVCSSHFRYDAIISASYMRWSIWGTF